MNFSAAILKVQVDEIFYEDHSEMGTRQRLKGETEESLNDAEWSDQSSEMYLARSVRSVFILQRKLLKLVISRL